MNILQSIFGGDSDTLTDGEFDGITLKKKFNAFIAFDGAVVTEILDLAGAEVTKNFVTDGTALEAGTIITFDKPVSSITCTGTIVQYGITSHQY